MMSNNHSYRSMNSWQLLAALIVLALVATPAASAPQNPMANRLTLDVYPRVEGVGSPQISPDGSTILYSRSFVDLQNDGRRSEVWMKLRL